MTFFLLESITHRLFVGRKTIWKIKIENDFLKNQGYKMTKTIAPSIKRGFVHIDRRLALELVVDVYPFVSSPFKMYAPHDLIFIKKI